MENVVMPWVLLILLAYCLGGIMFCSLLPRLILHRSIEQESPDGNPGGANCVSLYGWRIGVPATILDILKGFFPVYAGLTRLGFETPFFAALMVAPVLGHAVGVFNHHRGGKCIAVSFGVMLALLPVTSIPLTVLSSLYLLYVFLARSLPNQIKSIRVYSLFILIDTPALLFLRLMVLALGSAICAVIVIERHLTRIQEKEGEKVPVRAHLMNRLHQIVPRRKKQGS